MTLTTQTQALRAGWLDSLSLDLAFYSQPPSSAFSQNLKLGTNLIIKSHEFQPKTLGFVTPNVMFIAGLQSTTWSYWVVLNTRSYQSVRGTNTTEKNVNRVRVSTRYGHFNLSEVVLVQGRTTLYEIRLSTRYDLPKGMYDQVRGTTQNDVQLC